MLATLKWIANLAPFRELVYCQASNPLKTTRNHVITQFSRNVGQYLSDIAEDCRLHIRIYITYFSVPVVTFNRSHLLKFPEYQNRSAPFLVRRRNLFTWAHKIISISSDWTRNLPIFRNTIRPTPTMGDVISFLIQAQRDKTWQRPYWPCSARPLRCQEDLGIPTPDFTTNSVCTFCFV